MLQVSVPYISIGDAQIAPSLQARNLGVIFDSSMTLQPHINNIVRLSSYHIRNIGKIRKYLDKSATEKVIHAFVTSRLDNSNALVTRRSVGALSLSTVSPTTYHRDTNKFNFPKSVGLKYITRQLTIIK